MATNVAMPADLRRPRSLWVGRGVAALGYLGAVALMAPAALLRAVRPAESARPRLGRLLVHQCDWMLCAGVPLVGLVHVGLGSFLAMQAYYGATFVEAVGPVVGVGLFRNVAPLLSAFVLAGILSARVAIELARPPAHGAGADGSGAGDRLGLVAARLGAAALIGPMLALWGACAGAVIGWLVSLKILHIPTYIFFHKCFEMVWARDVTGLVVKGLAYGLAAALFPCYERLRGRGPAEVAALRAACCSALAILILNSTFYVLLYMAGAPFGPTVLKPPVS